MIDFIQQHFIAKAKNSKQLITSDARNNSYHYKFTSICDLAPICRDDLVLLPPKLSKELGGVGPIVLVYKVTTSVHMVDIHTMRTHEIDAVTYWQHTFKALAGRERLSEFIVISVEDLDQKDFSVSRTTIKNKMKMCQVEVCRKDDFMLPNMQTFYFRSHLGEFLNYNDTVKGYDLE